MSQSGMVATVPHIRQMARCMIVYVAMKEEYMLPRCIVLIEEKPVRAHTLVPNSFTALVGVCGEARRPTPTAGYARFVVGTLNRVDH